MAKTGNIAKQRQREAIVAKYAERRAGEHTASERQQNTANDTYGKE